MPAELSIADALTRIAETFSRLVVQNLQLLRSEVESEARAIEDQGRTIGRRLLRATPFLVAGVAIASLSIGEMLGLLLEPWLGRGSGPLCTLLFGLAEAAAAAAWLRGTLDRGARPGHTQLLAASDQPPPSSESHQPSWTQGSHSFPAASPGSIIEEKTHGSMG
jgi:hypothetical protein